MKRGVFVTGTDTGVGKTFVGCGIASALLSLGVRVGVMKPAETGCAVRRGSLVPDDALRLMAAARVADRLDLVNPYRFRTAVAPAVAAEETGKRIDLRTILKAYRTLAMRHEFLIVEGAGGIMVPLTVRRTYLDLAQRLALPVLVVARPNLGTINHTMLTIMAIRQRQLPIAGIVLNESIRHPWGPPERTNARMIEQMTGVEVIGMIRHGQRKGMLNLAIALR